VIWFDPQFAELSRNLSRALPGQPGVLVLVHGFRSPSPVSIVPMTSRVPTLLHGVNT